MSWEDAWRAVPIPAGQASYLIATAARAPSVQNTQPWRFREYVIELHADPGRKLKVDPAGREMLISCGAAPFGLRLAVRSLLAGLQHDALAEGAQLALVDRSIAYHKLADLAGAAGCWQNRDPVAREEMRRWSRSAAEPAPDGVPAHAFPARPAHKPRRLPQRDFDLGRGLGLLPGGGPPPAATAVLLTTGDGRADWLRAGQALHRLLAHAATRWVFASLHTQPLEAALIRALIRDRLALPGSPRCCCS